MDTEKQLIEFGLKCAKWSDFATKSERNDMPMIDARINVIKRLIKALNEQNKTTTLSHCYVLTNPFNNSIIGVYSKKEKADQRKLNLSRYDNKKKRINKL